LATGIEKREAGDAGLTVQAAIPALPPQL